MKAMGMKKHLGALLFAVALASPAGAQTINNLGAGAAVSGTDMFPAYQGALPAKRVTAAQINAYVQSLWGAGCATFLTTPSSANLRGCLTDEVGTGAFYTVGGALGTPASGTATNLTGLPISTGLTGAGTGVLTALGVNVGSAGAPLLFNGAGGTPSAITLTNGTGLPLSGHTSQAAWTFVVNNTSGSAAPTAVDIASFTLKASPAGTDLVVISDQAASGALKRASVSSIASAGSVSSIAGNTGAFTLNATSGITNSTNDIVCTQGSSSQFGCLKVDNTTITAASGIISAAAPTATPSTQTGTNYAFQSTDRSKVIYLSNASNQIPTIAAATGSFGAGWYTTACNIAAGTQTITPTTSTIGGASTLVLPAGSAAAPVCAGIVSDGTNYLIVPDYTTNASLLTSGTVAAARGGAGTITGALKGNGSGTVSQAACADLSNGTTLCSTTPGTGVATAAAVATGAAGGFPVVIASGTSALGTSAITSGSCATAVTTTATGAATTDVISWTPNADISAVTGYAPVTTGALIIYPYPTSGNVNWKVCNPTSSSITPGAVTLNWRITR